MGIVVHYSQNDSKMNLEEKSGCAVIFGGDCSHSWFIGGASRLSSFTFGSTERSDK